MANSAAPRGFRPVARLDGGGEYIRTYIHAAADSAAIGKWDLVTHTGAADTVEQFDAGDTVTGVGLNYVAASTLGNVSTMYISHETILEAQEDSVGGNIAAASENLNCTIAVAAANTTTGLSQMTLDSSSVATTSTLDVRLLCPSPRVGNVVAEAYTYWFCSPLDITFGQAMVGV